MTRLVCMFNKLDPRVEASLVKHAPEVGLEVEWIDTSADLHVYANELEKRWNGTEDIILVEQDKEIHAACLPEFLSCPNLWCGYTYFINPAPHTALVIGGFGVTKFSAEVQRMIPVQEFKGDGQINIDRRFDLALLKRRNRCCLHGHVVHHHIYEPRPQRVRDYVANLREQGIMPPAMYPEPRDPGLLPGSYRL